MEFFEEDIPENHTNVYKYISFITNRLGDYMAVRLSKMYGLDIYTDNGKYLGRVHDLIIDLEKGEIVRLTLEPLNFLVSKDEAMRILREKSLLYKNVKSVSDVVIVTQDLEK